MTANHVLQDISSAKRTVDYINQGNAESSSGSQKLDFTVYPYHPNMGVRISTVGHIDKLQFIEEVKSQLIQKGFEGELNIHEMSIEHTTQFLSGLVSAGAVVRPPEEIPITRVVDFHVPVFGEFLSQLEEDG